MLMTNTTNSPSSFFMGYAARQNAIFSLETEQWKM